MALLPGRDFLVVSTFCAGMTVAQPSAATQAEHQSPPQNHQRVTVLSPPPKTLPKLSLDFVPPPERRGQGPRLEELDNPYEDKDSPSRIELAEGVYGKVKPMSFRLTVLFP